MDEAPRSPPPAAAPTSAQPDAAGSVFALTWPPCAQAAVAVLLALSIGFLLGRWSSEGTPAADVSQLAGSGLRLDLNRASRAELQLLPGFGENLARRVEEHRQAHGPFARLEDLAGIPGIGPATIERVRPWLFIEPGQGVQAPAPKPSPIRVSAVAPPTTKQVQRTGLIDLNRADTAELEKLPGIGPKLAQRIADERLLRGPFQNVEELQRVSGIGPKTLEKVRPHVQVEPPTAVAGSR